MKDDLVFGDPTAPRFVLWGGKLRPVPSKPIDLPLFDLMSFGGKLRAGFGALGFRPAPPVCYLPPLHTSFALLSFFPIYLHRHTFIVGYTDQMVFVHS